MSVFKVMFGEHVARLGIAQVDHTPIDLILVDDINRLPIGRPWITIVLNVASRVVLGFHATLEAPSATSVAMALSMACLPKLKRLKELQLDFDWPMYGIPEVLHLDNASECNRPGNPSCG